MSPRTGRPKINNPKGTQLGVRFDDEGLSKLDKIAGYFDESRAECIRRAVDTLYSETKFEEMEDISMVECEICGNYFHIDEIEECPKCGMELCPSCYENHVSNCLFEEYDSVQEDYEEGTIPHFCPNCEEQLTLDIDPSENGTVKSARVYCEKCGFKQELDDSQIRELKGSDDEDDEVD